MKKLYICNRMRCNNCHYPVCQHTTDKEYALHQIDDGDRTFEHIGHVLVERTAGDSAAGYDPASGKSGEECG